MNIEELLKINDKSGKIFKELYIRKHYKSLYRKINEYCIKYDLIDILFKEKMYYYYHNLTEKKRCECGNLLKIINFNKGYSNHCSSKCAHNDIDVINKTKKTLLKNYGVDNLQKNNKIKEKRYETNLSKYGYKHPAQSKDILKKMVLTNIKNNGVSYPSQSKNVRNKYYETILQKKFLKYDNLVNVDYKNNKMEFKCDCDKDHNFTISIGLFNNRKKANLPLCTTCNTKYTPQLEKKFSKLFDNIKNTKNNRDILNPLELDIYIPELKLAFEFNGLYWHNEIHKENKYHLNKTELCETQGIQLIHIWEDDWIYKQEIVKSMILNKLVKINKKIFARKTEVKEVVDNKLIRDFLDKNHLQGFVGSKVKLGLFFNDELVSLMTFGSRRVAMGKKSTNDGEYELLRFCNKLNTNVIGGASKLFKYFIRNYQPNEITTYADRSHSNGNLYKKLGFELQEKTQPNYYYIIDGIRKHRFNYRKDKLVKEGYDLGKTEHQIMIERKIYRIYDSGNLKFIWKNLFEIHI